MNTRDLAARLDRDAPALMSVIVRIAPKAGLNPAETASIDQLAAAHNARHHR